MSAQLLSADNLLFQLNAERALRLNIERNLRDSLKENKRLNALLCTSTHYTIKVPRFKWEVLREQLRALRVAVWQGLAEAKEFFWPAHASED
jgi:hypothetical protein